MPLVRIGYSEGYGDALRDIYYWFENHSHIFHPIPRKLLLAILRHFMNNQDRLFTEKECLELEIFTPNNKKKNIEIKEYVK